jgi:L-cysteine/cystine lyase
VAVRVQVDPKVEQIRADLPAVRAKAYLNTGTNGPLPRVAHEALMGMATDEFEAGRISMAGWQVKGELKPAARAAVATAFGVKPSEIALTQLTTEGMNVMIFGVDWQRGDEAIVTNLEHPGGQLPLFNAARRFGVQIKLADLGIGDEDVVGRIERLITRRTRALVISHVAWNTGAVLPLKEIVEACRRHGVLVLVDAAQAAGMIPLDLYGNDPDAYAMPGQKWMCGPEGTGSLYINEARIGWFQQTYMGYNSAAHGTMDLQGAWSPPPGAERFDRISAYYPTIAGQKAATEWLNGIGWDWIHTRIKSLGELCYATLANIDGVSVITPRECMAGLVAFNVDGMAPADVVTALDERGFITRTIQNPSCVRVSTGFYNTEEEIENLGLAIEEIRRTL